MAICCMRLVVEDRLVGLLVEADVQRDVRYCRRSCVVVNNRVNWKT